MKLFVCYTMRDGELTPSLLRKVERMFMAAGHTIFIDYLNNDSEQKQERVMAELRCCDKVILLETSKVRDSEWASLELAYARKNHKEVIPYVLLNNKLIKQEACTKSL